jgi:hypothetical protein
MSVQLNLADLLVEAIKKPKEENPSPTQDSTSGATGYDAGSSSGEKHFNRVGRGASVSSAEDSESVDGTDSSTQDLNSSQQNTMNQIFYLLALASVNSSSSLENQSKILQMTTEQAQASSTMAQSNQVDLNNQLDQQAKRQKRMKILGWVVKSVAVIITVAMIAGSGGVLAAPLTTALMVAMTSLTIAAPGAIDKAVGGIASELEKVGLPPKVAEAVALLVVFMVILAATAGAGAADAAVVGSAASEAAGVATAQKLAGTATEEATLQYGKMTAGNMLMTSSQLLASTQLITKILLVAFPDNPKIDKIVGTATTLLFAIAGGVAGGALISSSGYMTNMVSENAESSLKMLTTGLRFLEGATQGGESWMLFEQGITSAKIAEINSNLSELQSISMISNQLIQIIQAAMKASNNTLEANSDAVRSLTLLGETILQKTAPAA